MVKKTLVVLVCFIGLTIFISTLHAQGLKKTITLPNGEVVWDLNGEWDVWIEFYGQWKTLDSYSQICKITQKGSSFKGVRLIADKWDRKGNQFLRGELDKSGFKKVQVISDRFGPLDVKGVISEDGNKVIFDDGVKVRETYTRK